MKIIEINKYAMKDILTYKCSFLIILFIINTGCKEDKKIKFSGSTNKISQKVINVQKTDIITFNDDTNYYKLDSVNVMSNNKLNYKIIILEDKTKQHQDNAQHDSLLIVIQKQESNNSYVNYLKNEKLIFNLGGNCPADGFQQIISKNNYFTIEQVYCKDFMFTQSYTTFKINDDETVTLHRYGEDYTDRSNPDKNIKGTSLATKDFGEVKFENVNIEFLRKLSNR